MWRTLGSTWSVRSSSLPTGTPAGTLDADPKLHVPDDVKAAREEALMLTQQAVCFDNMNYLVEEAVQFDVLIDGRSDDEGMTLGERISKRWWTQWSASRASTIGPR